MKLMKVNIGIKVLFVCYKMISKWKKFKQYYSTLTYTGWSKYLPKSE